MIEQICLNDTVLAAAKEVFSTMVFMEVKDSAEQRPSIEGDTILGLITFKGDLEGCLGIHCRLSCAKAVAQSMLGMDESEELDKAEVCDAIGEVSNMVMGSIKARLLDTHKEIDVSIPSVITGKKLENCLGDGAQKISIPVNIQDDFTAELSLLYKKTAN